MPKQQFKSKNIKTKTYITSICLNDEEVDKFEYLKSIYGVSGSALVRHMIEEFYNILRENGAPGL